mgnify:CR=1 FL=1
MLRRSRNTNGRSTPTQKLVERARAHKVRLMDKGRIIASRQKDKLLENVNKGRIIAKEQKTKLLAKVKKSNIIANVQNNKLIEKALWGKRRLAESYRYHISRLKYFKDIGRRWRTLRKIMPLSGLSVGNRIEIYADGSQVHCGLNSSSCLAIAKTLLISCRLSQKCGMLSAMRRSACG